LIASGSIIPLIIKFDDDIISSLSITHKMTALVEMDSITTLEALPHELLIKVLMDLPGKQVAQLCQLSRYLSTICSDWRFWADKAELDFGYPRQWFQENPIGFPSTRYGEIANLRTNPQQAMISAIVRGQRNYVKYILGLPGAIHGHGPIGMNPLDRSLRYAAAVGNVDLVNDFINHGARNLSEALDAALAGHHTLVILTLLRQLYDRGKISIYRFLDELYRLGYPDLAKRLIQETQLSPNIRQSAMGSGHARLVRPLIEFGFKQIRTSDLNWALIQSARRGDNDLVQYLLDHGATAVNAARQAASRPETIELLSTIRRK
jgi:hypothetical protein